MGWREVSAINVDQQEARLGGIAVGPNGGLLGTDADLSFPPGRLCLICGDSVFGF